MALFRRINIRKKMLLTFIPLTLLPMLLLIAISYSMFRSQMEGYTGNQVYESITQLSRHVDSYLEELDRLSMLPYYQPTLLSVMQERTETDILKLYYSTRTAESIISQSMINPREDLLNVFLYREDGRIIFISRNNVTLNESYDFQNSYWYNKALEGEGKAVFLGQYEDSRFYYPTNNFFSITRLIKSYDQHILGTILIDADFSGLEKLFNRVDLGDKANLVVLNQDNQIIYKQNELYLPMITANEYDVHTSGKMEMDNGKVMSFYSHSNLTGWKIVGLVSSQQLNEDILTMRNVIIMLSLCMFIAVVTASIIISHNISRPLIQLKGLMNDVQRGNFNVLMPMSRTEDEIGIVANAFNKMSSRIEELINQVAEVKIQQKQAELNQLKAQIRPHFLYNTLESIRALAELKEHYEIAEVTSSLGKILRYSITSHDRLVSIKSELFQAQNYLNIQQICSKYPILWVLDVEESILETYTIPLLLQPIIENAISHGFEEVTREGHIIVSARRTGRDILIEITDNGIGIRMKEVAALNRMLTTTMPNQALHSSSQFGIGLMNVAYRLYLLFGEPYGIMIESEFGVGTTVLMRVPYIVDPRQEQSVIIREGGVR